MALHQLRAKGKERTKDNPKRTAPLFIEVDGEKMKFRRPGLPDNYITDAEVLRVREKFPGQPEEFYREAVIMGRCYLPSQDDMKVAEESGEKLDATLFLAELALDAPMLFIGIKIPFMEAYKQAFNLSDAVDAEKNDSRQ